MKITIDDVAKTVEVTGDVNLAELVGMMKSLFPNWKEFTLRVMNNPPNIVGESIFYPNYGFIPCENPYEISATL